jgi:hypothetical protein
MMMSMLNGTGSYEETPVKEIQTWTEAEDIVLRQVVTSQKQLHWKEIAAHLPRRTNVQCYQRWHRTLKKKVGVVRRCWTSEEDEMLQRAIRDTRAKIGKEALSAAEWRTVAELLPGKSSKQCRKRWTHVLDPTLKKTKWSEEENEVLCRAHGDLGNRWAAIARLLPGRTELHVRDRWRKRQAQEAKEHGVQQQRPLHVQRQQIAQQWHLLNQQQQQDHQPQIPTGTLEAQQQQSQALMGQNPLSQQYRNPLQMQLQHIAQQQWPAQLLAQQQVQPHPQGLTQQHPQEIVQQHPQEIVQQHPQGQQLQHQQQQQQLMQLQQLQREQLAIQQSQQQLAQSQIATSAPIQSEQEQKMLAERLQQQQQPMEYDVENSLAQQHQPVGSTTAGTASAAARQAEQGKIQHAAARRAAGVFSHATAPAPPPPAERPGVFSDPSARRAVTRRRGENGEDMPGAPREQPQEQLDLLSMWFILA